MTTTRTTAGTGGEHPQDDAHAADMGATPTPASAALMAQDGHYVSPDGRWWWDGSKWRPAPPPKRLGRKDVLTGILAVASVVLGALAPFAAAMMLIGIADLRGSGIGPSWTDFLPTQVVLLPGAILGILALALRPPNLAFKLLAWMGIGGSVLADVLFTLVYFRA